MSNHQAAQAIRAQLAGKNDPVKAPPAAAPVTTPAEVPPAAATLDSAAAAAEAAAAAAAQAAADAGKTAPAAVAAPAPAAEDPPASSATLDGVTDTADAAADYAASNIAVRAAAAIQEWVETDDLDDNETLADRLLMSMVGIADGDQDGELDEDEQAVLQASLEAAWDYLSSKGVSDEDCSLLLNDWDDAAANRIRDLVASALPDGDEAAAEDIDNFAFGDDQEPALDDAGNVLDAIYKKRMVIRDGKKVRINKRVSGHIRLSARQKVGIRKAQMKSHTASAMMRRAKSVKKSRSMGLMK